MPDNAAALTGAALSLSQTQSAYAFFLPPLREVRQAGKSDPVMTGDVRLGQIAAGSLTIGIGVIMGGLTGSSLPVLVSIAIGLIIAFVYELALRNERLFERKSA